MSELIKDIYIIEVQLTDSKLKVSKIIQLMDPAISLENTTGTKSTSVVFKL